MSHAHTTRREGVAEATVASRCRADGSEPGTATPGFGLPDWAPPVAVSCAVPECRQPGVSPRLAPTCRGLSAVRRRPPDSIPGHCSGAPLESPKGVLGDTNGQLTGPRETRVGIPLSRSTAAAEGCPCASVVGWPPFSAVSRLYKQPATRYGCSGRISAGLSSDVPQDNLVKGQSI